MAGGTEGVTLPVLGNTSMEPGNSSADNYTNPYDIDYTTAMFYYYLWTKVTPAIFVLIILIGTLGNSLVIYVIASGRKMRTVTNFLLLNLAVSDIAFLLICVPFQAYKYASDRWPYGDWSCKLVQYFLYVTGCVTVWTLTSIAATRFATVVFSIQTARYRTKRNVAILAISIWTVMGFVNLPIIFVHQINEFMTITYCGLKPQFVEPVIVLFFALAYVLPLALICLLYMMIIRHLRANKATTITSSKNRTARACKVIIIVVVVFCVSWAPNHVISLLSLYGTIPDSIYFEAFRVLCHCMVYSNSVANPIIYNYASEEFRKAFKQAICCWCDDSKAKEGGAFATAKKKTLTTTDGGGENGECQSMMKHYNDKEQTILET